MTLLLFRPTHRTFKRASGSNAEVDPGDGGKDLIRKAICTVCVRLVTIRARLARGQA